MCLRLIFPMEFLSFSKAINSFEILPCFDSAIHYGIYVFKNISSGVKISVINILCFIWLGGAFISIIIYFVQYYIFCQKFKYIPPSKDAKILNILEKVKRQHNFNFEVKLIVNEVISTPSEFGIFRQTILLNDYKYNDTELYYILSHELIHFYSRSNRIKLFTELIKLIFWWNPIIYILRKFINFLLEVYVDSYIIKDLNKDSVTDYLNCILKVYKISGNISKPSLRFVNSIAADLDEHLFKKRIKIALSKHKVNIPICISILIILFTYIFISSRYVMQPAYDTTLTDFLTTEITSENSYIVKEGNSYVLYYNNEPFLSNSNFEQLPNVPFIKK